VLEKWMLKITKTSIFGAKNLLFHFTGIDCMEKTAYKDMLCAVVLYNL